MQRQVDDGPARAKSARGKQVADPVSVVRKASAAEHSEAVMRLFAKHQRRLFGYLMALVGDANDADDVYQEVCVVVWQKHQEFELGTNFVSWVSVIAYHQTQKYWRQRKRARSYLSTSVLGQLAENVNEDAELTEFRRQALRGCIAGLVEKDRDLVSMCYGDRKVTMKEVAKELGRPAGSVYKALNRIRKRLLDCVSRKIASEGFL